MGISNAQNQALLNSEISILLRSYNDIFSDFDPNTYIDRTLSDDFINQAKKMFINKIGKQLTLKLHLPANMRNEADEKIIIKGLHSHFNTMHQQLKSDLKKTNKIGWILTLSGIIIMIAASYLSFMKPDKYHAHLLIVLFEPAGWFLLWTGLDHLVYSLKETKKDRSFYSGMAKSEIIFSNH